MVPAGAEEGPASGALPLEPGTSSLGLAVGSSATSAPKGHGGLGSSWCALPRPRKIKLRLSLSHPRESPRSPSRAAFVPINPPGVSVRTSERMPHPGLQERKQRSRDRRGWSWHCPKKASSSLSHGLPLPPPTFSVPQCPGDWPFQLEGKGHQPGQARAYTTGMSLGAEAS